MLLTIIFLFSLLAAFVLICLKKWGILDEYEARRVYDWLPKGNCFFCLGFWLCVLFTAILQAFAFNPVYFIIPFVCAPLVNIFAVHD